MTLFKITLFLLLTSLTLQGANNEHPAFISNAKDFVEKVEMTTDRDIYFTNETLFFEGSLESTYADWSQIIYVEIISYNGKVQHQSKYKVNKSNIIEGSITLPDDVITGYYYLRGYTKWMRNYSPYNYFYKPILIINSKKDEILPISDNYKPETELDTLGKSYTISNEIKCTHSRFLKENYTDIQNSNIDYKSISLIREELVNDYSLGVKRENDTIFNYQFLPEIDGLTITGKITNDSIKIDLERATVFLSVLGETAYSSVRFTDQWGKFYFNLDDYYGYKEVMISISSQDGDHINFLIDNDYCNREVKLPFISPLTLDQEQWEKLNIPNANAQIESQIIKTKKDKKIAQFDEQIFYTDPTIRINMDDYIEMPTLKDYIYEIIPMLGIRYKNKIPKIVIRNSENRIKVKDYSALIIYDGLFISDVSSLLDISPREIESIEVLNQIFILGDNVFGGVVNIVSKNKNIENLALTEAGLFVDYMMLSEDIYKDRLPQKLKKRELLNNNTTLWSSNNEDEIQQYLVPDREGKYLLLFSKWEDGQLMRDAVRLNVE